MINKYPGTCSCGTRVEAGAGEARKIDGRWAVVCAACVKDPVIAEAAATLAAMPEAPVGTDRDVAEDRAYTLLSGHTASAYQAAVFDHFATGRGSAIVKAVAGAGKTTSIKNAIRFLDPRLHVQLFAFNTEAAGQLKAAIDELAERMPERSFRNVRAGTFHSVGFFAVRKFLGLPKEAVKADDAKCRKLLKAKYDDGTPEGQAFLRTYGAFATALVGYAKGEGVGAFTSAPDTEETWWRLIDHHGLYLDQDDADPAVGIEVAHALLAESNRVAREGWLDFDDMLYLVCLWKLSLWRNDVVVCDEAQDTNPVRRALLRLALKPTGRLYAVGDPKQSIYGFTGASVDAMDLIAREFRTVELPLTVSYRCSRAVVERAQTWVPYIEPAETAAEGAVLDDVPLHRALELLTAQDAILCRNTAPLVEVAYGLIARGRPCRIMGREIGEGLVNLIEQQNARGIDRLIEKLEIFRERETSKFIARGDERRAEGVADRVNCVLTIVSKLPETGRTIPALVERIRGMFDDRRDTGVLTLATMHKSKGQEWAQVAILRPELAPSKAARQEWQEEQEWNLLYVATTRAKVRSIWCAPEDMTIDQEAA